MLAFYPFFLGLRVFRTGLVTEAIIGAADGGVFTVTAGSGAFACASAAGLSAGTAGAGASLGAGATTAGGAAAFALFGRRGFLLSMRPSTAMIGGVFFPASFIISFSARGLAALISFCIFVE